MQKKQIKIRRPDSISNSWYKTSDFPVEPPIKLKLQIDAVHVINVIANISPVVNKWYKYLEEEHLRSFLNETNKDIVTQSDERLDKLSSEGYFDNGVVLCLNHMLVNYHNWLSGIAQLIYNLYLHNIEAILLVLNISKSNVNQVVNLIKSIFNTCGNRYVEIFTKSILKDQLIENLDPHIKDCEPAVIDNIRRAVGNATNLNILFEMIKVFLHGTLRHPVFIDNLQSSTIMFSEYQANGHVERTSVEEIRLLQKIESMSKQDVIIVYLRLIAPNICKAYYKSIRETAEYIADPENHNTWKISSADLKRKKLYDQIGRCTFRDVKYNNLDRPGEFVVRPFGL